MPESFKSESFAAKSFASESWRGASGVSPLKSVTSWNWDITGITLKRSGTRGMDPVDLANFVATLVYDYENGIYDGSNYNMTGNNTDRHLDCDGDAFGSVYDVAATLVDDNAGTRLDAYAFTYENETERYTMTPATATGALVADILAMLLKRRGPIANPQIEFSLEPNRQHFTLPANRCHFAVDTNRQHYTIPG